MNCLAKFYFEHALQFVNDFEYSTDSTNFNFRVIKSALWRNCSDFGGKSFNFRVNYKFDRNALRAPHFSAGKCFGNLKTRTQS